MYWIEDSTPSVTSVVTWIIPEYKMVHCSIFGRSVEDNIVSVYNIPTAFATNIFAETTTYYIPEYSFPEYGRIFMCFAGARLVFIRARLRSQERRYHWKAVLKVIPVLGYNMVCIDLYLNGRAISTQEKNQQCLGIFQLIVLSALLKFIRKLGIGVACDDTRGAEMPCLYTSHFQAWWTSKTADHALQKLHRFQSFKPPRPLVAGFL